MRFCAADEAAPVRGVVHDQTGAPIQGAEVTPRSVSPVVTLADGSFAFDPASAREGRLVVRAKGFVTAEQAWSRDSREPLVVVLERARFAEDVTVTASRGETQIGDTAARVVVIDGAALAATAAPTLDDALRQVPGFSLFRRSDSRVANPTSQGASLRGVGASGASRTLVLLDGIPLNDPFGGWVYWSRVPRESIDRVEVVEGGASDLYGSAALGGVVQAFQRTDAPALRVEATGGTEGTGGLSTYAAERHGDWSLRGAGEVLTTNGYVLVPSGVAGPVDTAAGEGHVSGSLAVERRLSQGATVFVRGGGFGESRTNGTPLQVNDTNWGEISAGSDVSTNGGGAFSLRTWYAGETYHQAFSAVAANRTTESLTRLQRVPSESSGLALTWSRNMGSANALLAGIDGRLVHGRSDETGFSQGKPSGASSTGGRDRTLAAFATDRVSLGSRTLVTLGARVDDWSGGTHGATALSPRASVLFRARRSLSVTASSYGAFRSPTLNELYRSFRVGNTLTLANPDLTVERLWGGEAGVAWKLPDDRLRLRAVAFTSRIENPVANVTLQVTPQLITRERENLGRNRSQGVEFDAEARLGPRMHATVGYGFIDATVLRFSANPDLEGNQVPQVPRHQLTFEARFTDRRLFDLSVQGRTSSRQFDDDQNLLPLPGYFTVDARGSRHVGRFTAFVAAENLTGQRAAVGLTPTPTEGPPRLWRVGIRFE